MGLRRMNEVREIHFYPCEGGLSLIAKPEHIESFLRYYRRKGLEIQPTGPIEQGADHMLEFPAEANGVILDSVLNKWKEWYASDALQVLDRYMETLKQFGRNHPTARPVLRISETALTDFSRCTMEHWESENWDVDGYDVRMIQSGDRTKAIEALTRIFSRHGVDQIEVVNRGVFEILPADHSGE